MRLADLINSVGANFRNVTHWVTNPEANLLRVARNRTQEIYQNLEIPLNRENRNQEQTEETPIPTRQKTRLNTKSGITKITAIANPPPVEEDGTKPIAQVPPLNKEHQIRGRRGNYKIASDPIETGDRVRQYKAIQTGNDKEVLIQEFILPPGEFDESQTEECKRDFEQLANLSFKKGEGQDFRLITPLDGIAELSKPRCYLITEVSSHRNLKQYITDKGPMTCEQVREVLRQVLQSLDFIHSKKISLHRAIALNGFTHGNLNLKSLIIIHTNRITNTNKDFYIYLTDFSIWSNLCSDPNYNFDNNTWEKDLKDLGIVCSQLLTGINNEPLTRENWKQIESQIEDIALAQYIRRLLQLDRKFTGYKSAEHALQELLSNTTPKSRTAQPENLPLEPETQQDPETVITSKKLILIGFALLSLTFGFSSTLFMLNRIPSGKDLPITDGNVTCSDNKFPYCNFNNVRIASTEDTNKRFTYTASIADGVWKDLSEKPVTAGQNFKQELAKQLKEQLTLDGKYDPNKPSLTYQPSKSFDVAIQKLKDNEVDFFITSLTPKEKKEINEGLKYEVIAYDALVALVAYSDSSERNKRDSIPHKLEGKITTNELRQLYTRDTGQFKGDRNLDRLNGYDIKLYFPKDNLYATKFFKEIVLENKDNDVNTFNSLIQDITKRENLNRPADRKVKDILSSQTVMQQIFNDFNNKQNSQPSVSISFDSLSRVFGQCTVYPLAVDDAQVLLENNGQKITPNTDLCRKRSYQFNINSFTGGNMDKQYPLAYPIAIVYNEKNSYIAKKMINIFTSDEGQRLFVEAGFVPKRKMQSK